MTAREIHDLALRGGGNDFQATVELLERLGEPWCLIGGLAVNVYCEPVYTADADFVIVPPSSNLCALSWPGWASRFRTTLESMPACPARASWYNLRPIRVTKIS
jgi:hypothetical protein